MYKSSPAPPRQLALSLQLIADALDDRLWAFSVHSRDQARFYSFRVFTRGESPEPGVLYILPAECGAFPRDKLPYVAVGEQPGGAEHICVYDRDLLETVNELSRIFQRFRRFEAELNWILTHGGSLSDLCVTGISYLQNPVYIHDSSFAILALPCHVEGMLELDYNEKTEKYFIPLWLVEDFKFNEGYQDTLHRRKASIWDTSQYPYHMRSLYVNIWDVNYYRARLLVNELHTALRPGDYLLAEYLAEYALQILRRDDMSAGEHHQDLAGTFKSLIVSGEADRRDLHYLLATLGWSETDRFLLSKLQSQNQETGITSINVLRSSLSAVFPGTFICFFEQQLYIIADMAASRLDPTALRSRLSPFLRDSLMYAGISLPVENILHLNTACVQADWALDRAFRMRGHQWCVNFEDCALEYLISRIETPTPIPLYLSPVPRFLQQYDREHGSQYFLTLKSFLQNERSIPRTAAALIVHRTTLLYRLEKIIALTRLDLDDEAVRLYLLLSFRLMEES